MADGQIYIIATKVPLTYSNHMTPPLQIQAPLTPFTLLCLTDLCRELQPNTLTFVHTKRRVAVRGSAAEITCHERAEPSETIGCLHFHGHELEKGLSCKVPLI